MTLEQLMQEAGCSKYPKRWSEIYETAMEVYDRQGCYLADPAYYDIMQEKFDCFGMYLEAYKKAAEQVSEDENLGRFLTLLTMALLDKEYCQEDVKNFDRPSTPPGKEPLGYEMVTGLALCAQLNEAVKKFEKKGFPEDIIRDTLRIAVGGVGNYVRTHHGAWGYDLLWWAQLYVEGKLFLIDRLEMELHSRFEGKAVVFQNGEGEIVSFAKDIMVHRDGMALGSLYYEDEEGAFEATLAETEDAYIGYPYGKDGRVSSEKIVLAKEEWKLVLQKGDPVVRIHIPREGKLTPESVERTIEKTIQFLKQHYPEYTYKAFACCSWLTDPQLIEMLGEDSNIAKFCNRFQSLTLKSNGRAVYYFVFSQPDDKFEFKDLPENTRLEKMLKRHYMDGKAIYEMEGFFLPKNR